VSSPGCGQGKYDANDGAVIGVDICEQVLQQVKVDEHKDAVLGDTLRLPLR
jgi:hypothetical protein